MTIQLGKQNMRSNKKSKARSLMGILVGGSLLFAAGCADKHPEAPIEDTMWRTFPKVAPYTEVNGDLTFKIQPVSGVNQDQIFSAGEDVYGIAGKMLKKGDVEPQKFVAYVGVHESKGKVEMTPNIASILFVLPNGLKKIYTALDQDHFTYEVTKDGTESAYGIFNMKTKAFDTYRCKAQESGQMVCEKMDVPVTGDPIRFWKQCSETLVKGSFCRVKRLLGQWRDNSGNPVVQPRNLANERIAQKAKKDDMRARGATCCP